MLVEVAGDEMYFQVISRTGETVDSGTIARVATMNPAAYLKEPRGMMASLWRFEVNTDLLVRLIIDDATAMHSRHCVR